MISIPFSSGVAALAQKSPSASKVTKQAASEFLGLTKKQAPLNNFKGWGLAGKLRRNPEFMAKLSKFDENCRKIGEFLRNLNEPPVNRLPMPRIPGTPPWTPHGNI